MKRSRPKNIDKALERSLKRAQRKEKLAPFWAAIQNDPTAALVAACVFVVLCSLSLFVLATGLHILNRFGVIGLLWASATIGLVVLDEL